MKITLTLRDVLDRTDDWTRFCEEFGFSEWAVNEGGGDLEVTLTEEQANRYRIIRTE